MAILLNTQISGKLTISGSRDDTVTLPNYTTSERDALSSAAGDIVFNESTAKTQFYTGNAWSDAVGRQGAQGIQGFQGLHGTPGGGGNAGASGAQGYQGAKGSAGYSGYHGAIGGGGPTGDQGPRSGAKGPGGATGYSGLQGATNNQAGTQGPKGPKGPKGPAGYTGFHGADGGTGGGGAYGARDGAKGSAGDTGYSGYHGNANAQTGARGSRSGAKGPHGYSGYQGETNNAGGARGSRGGPKGADGWTGYHGNTNTGTGARGPRGGAKGAAGYTGYMGNAGATGAPGWPYQAMDSNSTPTFAGASAGHTAQTSAYMLWTSSHYAVNHTEMYNTNNYGMVGRGNVSTMNLINKNGQVAGTYWSTGGNLFMDGSRWSDERAKTEITNYTGSGAEPTSSIVERLSTLKPKKFRFINTPSTEPITVGLIAQDVKLRFPELVNAKNDGTGSAATPEMMGINYTGLRAVLYEAVKELKTELSGITTRITTLETA